MPVNILTQRNAVDRRGVNRQETILNVGNVDFTQFGRIGSYPVKGSVYAQPLYVSAVDCAAKGLHSLVIIATMENAVYAYDAEHTGAAARVWAIEGPAGPTLGESVDSKIFDAEGNPYEDFYGKSIGILSTPVIELAGVGPVSGVIYLVSFQFDRTAFAANGNKATSAMFSHVLYALDLGTGQILRKIPVAGRYPGGGYASSPTREKIPLTSPLNIDSTTHTASIAIPFAGKDKMVRVVDAERLGSPQNAVLFNSIMQLQRPALLLQDGALVIAFGSRGDDDPYHGWVFSYDAATFRQTGVFCTTPNGIRGGIWQAGQGLVQDSKKSFYASTGNGDNDKPGTGPLRLGMNFGESFLKFRCDSTGVKLNGWFCLFKDIGQSGKSTSPESADDDLDDDFGAGAPALLPDDRIVAGGKDGWFFLIDPDQLDKIGSADAVPQAFKASFNVARGSRVGNQGADKTSRHIHGSPVVWDTRAGPVFVYVWGENDVVRVYQYAPETGQDPRSGRFLDQPQDFKFGNVPEQGVDFARGNIYASNEDAQRHGMPGGFLSLTENGAAPDTAILWAAYPPRANANLGNVDGAIIAYDASNFDHNLGYKRLTMLWNSGQVPGDTLGSFTKFCCPTIANGRVYHATGDGQIAIYGIRSARVFAQIGFDGGGAGFTLNGSARLSNTGSVILTEHAQGKANADDTTPTFLAGSFFTRQTFNIRQFETNFTFKLTAAGADGFTFTIQAEGPRAIGSSGSGLGYMIDRFAPFAAEMQSTILHSFAVKFGLRDENGAAVSRLALLVNGAQMANFVDVDLLQTRPGPIDLRSGNPITARLSYDGEILFVQLTDEKTKAATQNFRLIAGDISAAINSVQGLAFVGFTGGTGGLSAEQEIVRWDFQTAIA